ncbi:MAG: DMT family transporter [Candidatus Puniceispirillum sp.]|nr:DMT family transporter [Candidatus Puniceispirillum sp.]MBL6774802.1 DMT family transporter [Candidatus Puniceispirillum sp.]
MIINWTILITLGAIWGASFLGVELALTGFGPVTVAAGRVAAAGLILVFIAIAYGDGLPRFRTATDRRIWLHCLGMAFFTNAIPFCLLSWGQQIVTSGFAGISMAVVPLFVLPLSHFLVPGEVMSRIKIVGFLFGFMGVVLLIGGDKILASTTPSPLMFTAQFACITASACYAIGSIITRLCPPVSALSFAAAGLMLGGIILIPAALIIDGVPTPPADIAFAGLAYLAIFPTAIATILLTVLVRRAGPPFLSLVNYQVPVWAVVIGAIVLDDALPGHFLMALVVILSGLFIAQLGRRRQGKQ